MKIAFYMPFKPLGHRNPSGDLVIGTELFRYLKSQGADIRLVSRFRCRWIYLKPWLWPLLCAEIFRVIWGCFRQRPDVWLTYHSYYKAPDVIGPLCCRMLGIPYTVFQGIYSTKRRKKLKTRVGFSLNRRALRMAKIVFVNKRVDAKNLKRLLPDENICYLPPGMHPGLFRYNEKARNELRAKLQVGKRVLVMTTAMFRPGVKTEGVREVIRGCGILMQHGCDIQLIIAGDGSGRQELEAEAAIHLADKYVFLGRVDREQLGDYYSAADIFAFPGIKESLGMVYLEAQSCRLPVVAYGDWGASEAVVDAKTGLLACARRPESFTECMKQLVNDAHLRENMGRAAEAHVRQNHDLDANYAVLQTRLQQVIRQTSKK